jgi:hypothetical protein
MPRNAGSNISQLVGIPTNCLVVCRPRAQDSARRSFRRSVSCRPVCKEHPLRARSPPEVESQPIRRLYRVVIRCCIPWCRRWARHRPRPIEINCADAILANDAIAIKPKSLFIETGPAAAIPKLKRLIIARIKNIAGANSDHTREAKYATGSLHQMPGTNLPDVYRPAPDSPDATGPR